MEEDRVARRRLSHINTEIQQIHPAAVNTTGQGSRSGIPGNTRSCGWKTQADSVAAVRS